ncbi:MAG: carboxypeptidase-like regulatory domain-containing protein [Chitinophagaceae bacterium]|nr:carboxypeptidase-like regulatory domain-containing protein [Chitinophagaceae bacterium]
MSMVKTVADYSTKKAISFAHVVSRKHPQNGSLTNEDGRFVLYLRSANDTIEISHVGYRKQRVPATFSGDTIFLENTPTLLDEVVITDYTAAEVMNKVIDLLRVNHAVEPVTYRAFIRVVEYPADTSAIHIFEEHVMDIHQTKAHNSKFRIIKTRVGAFSKPGQLRLKDRRLIIAISVFSDNLFKIQEDVFRKNKMKDYVYEFASTDGERDTLFYSIRCRSKSDTAQVSAELLIDKKTYGIAMKRNYYYSGNHKTFKEIHFQKIDNKWYLAYSVRTFKTDFYGKHGGGDFVNIDRVCLYNPVSEKVNLEDFKSTLYTMPKPISNYTDDFNDSFWQNVNYIPMPRWISKRLQNAAP